MDNFFEKVIFVFYKVETFSSCVFTYKLLFIFPFSYTQRRLIDVFLSPCKWEDLNPQKTDKVHLSTHILHTLDGGKNKLKRALRPPQTLQKRFGLALLLTLNIHFQSLTHFGFVFWAVYITFMHIHFNSRKEYEWVCFSMRQMCVVIAPM